MASITISRVDPQYYNFDSCFIAIKYTISNGARPSMRSVSLYYSDPFGVNYEFTYGNGLIDTYNINDNEAIFIVLLKENKCTIKAKYEDDETSIYSNSIENVSPIFPQIASSEFSLSNYQLKIPILFPADASIFKSYRYTDAIMHFDIVFNNKTYHFEFDYQANLPTVINNITRELTFNLSNEISELLSISVDQTLFFGSIFFYPCYNFSSSFYIGYNFMIDCNALFENTPTLPVFKFKNTNSNFSALFGDDYTAPYGYKNWAVEIITPSIVESGDTVSEYEVRLSENTGFRSRIKGSTNIINYDREINIGTYTPHIRSVSSKGIFSYSAISNNSINIIPYEKPTFSNVSCTRLNGFDLETTVIFTVRYYSLNYNNSNRNSLKSIKYRFKDTDSNTYSNYVTTGITNISSEITTNSNGINIYENTYEFTTSLDNGKSFEIELFAEDQVETNTITTLVGQGVPLFCQSEDGYVTVGKIPDWNHTDCKFQVESDLLGKDIKSNKDVEIIKNIVEIEDKIIPNVTSSISTILKSGLSNEYCNTSNNETATNYNSNTWRIICDRERMDYDDGTWSWNYNIDYINSTSMSPSSNITLQGFNIFARDNGICKDNFPLVAGRKYTISFYAKLDTEAIIIHPINCYACFDNFLSFPYEIIGTRSPIGTLTEEWILFKTSFVCEDTTKNSLYIYFGFGNESSFGYVDFCGMKVEEEIEPMQKSNIFSITNLFDLIYPVGSYYMSENSTNPSLLFGGTWERIKGRVLVGVDEDQTEFNEVNKEGGSKYLQHHSHTLSGTAVSAGAHTHPLSYDRDTASGSAKKRVSPNGTGATSSAGGAKSSGAHSHTLSGTAVATGSGNAQNLQPYVTCYIWKRIA